MKASAYLISPKEWLYRLEDEDDPESDFSPWDRQLVQDVCFEFKRELDGKDFASFDSCERHQMSIIEDNLKTIIQELKINKREKLRFVSKYHEWREVRQESIKVLEAIGTTINTDRKKCNISRLVGNCTSLVGGGICVASAAMIPFTLGMSTPFAIAGGVTTVLGSATSIGASVTELTLLKKNVQKACNVLENDRAAFECLERWLTSASELTKAIEAILSIDADNKIEFVLSVLNDFLDSVKGVHNEIKRSSIIKNLIKTLLNALDKTALLTAVPCMIGLLLVLALLLNKSSLSGAKPWETLAKRFSLIANFSIGVIGPLATALSKGEVVLAQCVTKAVARGAVGIIGMTLDVACIILTSIDVHNGSVSEEGLKILEVVREMKEEVTLLDNVYNEALELQ